MKLRCLDLFCCARAALSAIDVAGIRAGVIEECPLCAIGLTPIQCNQGPTHFGPLGNTLCVSRALSGISADGWMPIETAPKDGTPVIFYAPAPSIFISPSTAEKWTPSKNQQAKMIAAGADWPNTKWNPTHWRQLPPPPAPSMGKENGE